MKYYCSFIVLFFISIPFLDAGTGKNDSKNQSTLGFEKTKLEPGTGLCQVVFTDKETVSFAVFQDNPNKKTGILNEVDFKVLAFKPDVDSVVYKINIMSVDLKTQIPHNVLSELDFHTSWKKGDSRTLKMDMTGYGINIPEEGFFITIECVGNFDKNGNKIAGSIGYKFAKGMSEKPNSFTQWSGKEWKSNLFFDSKQGQYSNLNIWSLVEFN
jgi:hypothetical protein